MCLKSISTLISAFTTVNKPQQQDDEIKPKSFCKKPPEKPCYEQEQGAKSIQYEFSYIAISSK